MATVNKHKIQYGGISSKKLVCYAITILVLCSPTHSFDLLSALMAQGSSSLPNLKSIVSPEILEKMKGMLPYTSHGGSHDQSNLGKSDVAQIEKLLAKLKPAEGRFDPAVLELLASMDHRQHLLSQSQTIPSQNRNNHNGNKHKKSTTPHTIDYQTSSTDEELRQYDSVQDSHHEVEPEQEHSTPTRPTTPPATTTKAFQEEGKPKFSSKFRLPIQKNRKQKNKESPPHPVENTSHSYDYVLDPNIRNHRLYELELSDGHRQQERFENYENFTALDQMEDLLAEESYDHHEIAVPAPTTSERPRTPSHKQKMQKVRSTTMRTTAPQMNVNINANNGWAGKSRTRKPEVHPMPIEMPTSSSSYEELVSFETETDEDMSSHDREPLRRASTEKTVVYSYPVNSAMSPGSSEPMYDPEKSYEQTGTTTNKFRPSPMDLSPPVYFEPDQDFYTATLNNKHRSKSSNQHHRRKQQQQQTAMYDTNHGVDPDHFHTDGVEHGYTTSSLSHHDNMKFHGDSHGDYGTPPPQDFSFPQNQNQNQNPQFYQPTTPQYTQNMNVNPSNLYPPPNNGHLNQKQDRILQGDSMSMHPLTPMQQPTVYGPGHGFPQQQGHQQHHPLTYADTFQNSHFPAGSENVYHEVAMNPYMYHNNPQSSNNDLAYSAGQNYYHNSGYGGSDHGHHHLHPQESSWTSTFFILGGLVALSAMIAFFLPSFLAGSTTGGKDNGIDKISNNESDLWTEIKGLYTDIVSIAKGDYSNFQRHGPIPHHQNLNDLPNIHVLEDETDDEEKETPEPDLLAKRIGDGVGDESSDSYSSEEDLVTSTAAVQAAEADESSTDAQSLLQSQTMALSDYKIEKKEKKDRKPANRNDTLAFGVYNNGPIGTTSRNGLDFANAFNQTISAWEKVPLLPN